MGLQVVRPFRHPKVPGPVLGGANTIAEVRIYYATIVAGGTAAYVDHAVSITDIGNTSKAVVRLLGAPNRNQYNEAGTSRAIEPHIRFKDSDEVYINIYDSYTGQSFRFCFSVTKYRAPVVVKHYTGTFVFGAGGWADVAASITDVGHKYAANRAEIVPGMLLDDISTTAGVVVAQDCKWRWKDSDEVYLRAFCTSLGTTRSCPFSVVTY